MDPNMKTNDCSSALMANPALSRRAFFGLSAIAGSLHFLGSVLGGRVCAYADDNGEPFFIIAVLTEEDIAIVSVDPSNNMAAVPGVTVSLYSHAVKKSADEIYPEGLATDEYGYLMVNIRPLSEQADQENAEIYTFWGSLEAWLPDSGYREYALGKMRVIGGAKADQTANFTIPMEPFDAKKDGAYLRRATYDGADIQYYSQTIPQYASDNIDHEMLFQVGGKPGAQAQASVYAGEPGKETLVAGPKKATIENTGYAEIAFWDKWVTKYAIGTSFKVEFGSGGKTYRMNLQFALEEAPWNLPEPIRGPEVEFSMGSGLDFEQARGTANWNFGDLPIWPDVNKEIFNIPGLPGGRALNVIGTLPWMPVSFATDSYGGVGISINMKTIDIYNTDDGFFDPKEWRSKTSKECRDSLEQELEKRVDKATDAYSSSRSQQKAGKKGFFGLLTDSSGRWQSAWFGSFSATFDASLIIMFYREYTNGNQSNQLEGGSEGLASANALAGMPDIAFSAAPKILLYLILDGEFGVKVMIGAVPAFLAFGLYIEADFSAQAGFRADCIWRNGYYAIENPKFFWTDGLMGEGGFLFDLLIRFTMTLGVGLKGVCAFGVKGGVEVEAVFDGTSEGQKEGKSYPHRTWTLLGFLRGFVQALFWSFTTDLCKWDPVVLADSWRDSENDTLQLPKVDMDSWMPQYMLDYEKATTGLNDDKNTHVHYTTDLDLLHRDSPETDELIVAGINAQGVPCNYNFSRTDASFAAFSKKLQSQGGIKNPFNAKRPFDARKGVRPSTDGPIVTGSFSDPRIRIHDLGSKHGDEMTYNFRLETVNVKIDENYAEVYEGHGVYVAIPKPEAAIPENGFAAVSLHEGGEVYAPAVADIFVERYEGDTEEEVNARLSMIERLTDGSANAALRQAAGTPANVDTVPRTRLIVTPYNGETKQFGESDVIDFAIPSVSAYTSRCNMHDIDFHVQPETTADGTLLFRIGLTSIARENVTPTDYTEQLKYMYTSTLRYNPAEASGKRVSDVHCNLVDQMVGNYDWNALPTRVMRGDDGKIVDCACLVSKGNREGKEILTVRTYPIDERGSLRTNTCIAKTPQGLDLDSDDFGELSVYVTENIRKDSKDAIVLVFQKAKNTLSDAEGTHEEAFVWTVDPTTGEMYSDWKIEGAHNITVLGGGKGIAYMVDGAEEGRFNLHVRNFISREEFEPQDDTKTLMGVQSSPTFSSSTNGEYLFSHRTSESGDQAYTEHMKKVAADPSVDFHSNETPYLPENAGLAAIRKGVNAVDSNIYQVMCAQWNPRKKEFHVSYPYGVLGFAPDTSAAYMHPSRMSLMYSTVTNLFYQRANTNFAIIDHVVSAQVDAALCLDGFIKQGGTVHPIIAVTNTGNQPLRQINLLFTEQATGFTQEFVMDDLRTWVLQPFDHSSDVTGAAAPIKEGEESPWNRDDEITLWPGDTRKYQFPFETPKDWDNTTHVIEVTISGTVVDDFSDVTGAPSNRQVLQNAGNLAEMETVQENPAGYVVCLDPSKTPITFSAHDERELKVPAGLKQADYIPVEDGEEKPLPEDDGKKTDVIPDTGDSGALGVAVAAAAAAGAVAVASATKAFAQEEDETE